MEYSINPAGGSGQQWDAWEAMFSPHDADTGFPKPAYDSRTGEIDTSVVEHWRRFDITKIVAGDWTRFGPIVMQRVRLNCGDHDSFYLNRAVDRFKQCVEALAEESGGWKGDGYVRLTPYATHFTITPMTQHRVYSEMRAYLKKHELTD